MSNWSTYETEIINRLATLGYTQQPDNYEPDDADASNSYVDKGYSIKPVEVDRESITDGHGYHTYLVELKISFVNVPNSRSTNFGTFDDLISEFINGGTYFPNFVSLNGNPTFIDDDISLQNSIGTITMWYGMRGC